MTTDTQQPETYAGPALNETPATIHTESGPFVVPDVNGWGTFPEGDYFASGYWMDTERYVDVLLPRERVRWVELHFDQLQAYIDSTVEPEEAPDA